MAKTKTPPKCGFCSTNNHAMCRVVIPNGAHGLFDCECGCEQTEEYKAERLEIAQKNLAFEMRSKKS